MSETEDILFLAIAGFLFGNFLFTGWYTTRYEPESKPGYAFIGIGLVTSVTANVWLEFATDASTWYLGTMLIAYAIISAGLVLIVRNRRRRSERLNVKQRRG